jgi:hypothetical protein
MPFNSASDAFELRPDVRRFERLTLDPQLVLGPLRQSPPNKHVCVFWNAVLLACPVFMGSVTFSTLYDTPGDGDGGKVRSDSHWSPYDPVRVVNVDP